MFKSKYDLALSHSATNINHKKIVWIYFALKSELEEAKLYLQSEVNQKCYFE